MCYLLVLIPPEKDWCSLKPDFKFRCFGVFLLFFFLAQKLLDGGNGNNNFKKSCFVLFCFSF